MSTKSKRTEFIIAYLRHRGNPRNVIKEMGWKSTNYASYYNYLKKIGISTKTRIMTIYAFGERKTLKEWASSEKSGTNVSAAIITKRIKDGWQSEDAISKNVVSRKFKYSDIQLETAYGMWVFEKGFKKIRESTGVSRYKIESLIIDPPKKMVIPDGGYYCSPDCRLFITFRPTQRTVVKRIDNGYGKIVDILEEEEEFLKFSEEHEIEVRRYSC